MDNIETILQVIFVIIFVFGRFILRMLLGVKKRAPKLPAPAKKAVKPEVVSRPAQVARPVPAKRIEARRKEAPMSRRPAPQPTAPSLDRMADAVIASLEVQKERSRATANTCHFRGFNELQRNILLYDAQIRDLLTQLDDLKDNQKLNRTAVDSYDKAVRLIDERLDGFDALLKERGTSAGQQYNAADRILADLITTCQKRHRGGQSLYQYLFPGVVHDPGLVKGGLYGVVVPPPDILNALRWCNLGFHMHLAVSQRGRFAAKIAGEMGLPQASGSLSYFMSTGRLMAAGLISSWMDWIYADVSATLQLGEAYAWPFLEQCERDEQEQSAELTLFDMDSRSRVSRMPLLARLITVHAVLQKMESARLDEFADRVARMMKAHSHLTLEIQGKTQIPLAAADVFGDLFQVAFTLIDTPLSVLDSYSPEEIWGTDFSAEKQKKLTATAETLATGKPVSNVRPISLLLAAHLARMLAHNAERRIEGAVLKSLKSKEDVQLPVLTHSLSKGASPRTLADVFSPDMLPQTVIIGALARSRGGISSIH